MQQMTVITFVAVQITGYISQAALKVNMNMIACHGFGRAAGWLHQPSLLFTSEIACVAGHAACFRQGTLSPSSSSSHIPFCVLVGFEQCLSSAIIRQMVAPNIRSMNDFQDCVEDVVEPHIRT